MAMLDVILGPMFFIPIILIFAVPVVLIVTIIMAIVRWKKRSKEESESKDEE